MAAGEYATSVATGDVSRIGDVLGTERPDRSPVVVDTEPTDRRWWPVSNPGTTGTRSASTGT
jgi:hypothetical protein